MIRFCDKEIVTCSMEEIETMTRGELISFFIRNDTTLIIMVFDEDGLLIGSITYQNVLKYMRLDEYLNKNKLQISESFWEEVREYFEEDKRAVYPVCNEENQVLGFCYNDYDSTHNTSHIQIEGFLEWLEQNLDDALFLQEIWPSVEQVCITDCNEWAFRIYQLCLRKQIPVCLIGEKWEWFGQRTCEGIYEYPDYAKFYIYAEGHKVTRGTDGLLNYHGENVISDFEFVRTIGFANAARIRYEKETLLNEKGVEICNIIVPTAEEVTYMTKAELETARFGVSFLKYLSAYDCLSDLQKELIRTYTNL